jgi:hypothetical protein
MFLHIMGKGADQDESFDAFRVGRGIADDETASHPCPYKDDILALGRREDGSQVVGRVLVKMVQHVAP